MRKYIQWGPQLERRRSLPSCCSIRLATHLYAEHLLERDHYVDWLVSGLENSPQARLPMWFLMIQVYWKDLLRARKTGRRLAAAVLQHHSAVHHHPDRDLLLPLYNQLSSLLRSFLLTGRESFVQPATWSKYRATVLSSLPSDDIAQRNAFQITDARNDQLTNTHVKSQPAVRGIVVKLLDTTLRKPFHDDLAAQIWKVSEDKLGLAKVVLEWCISLYRSGIAKVFVTATILRSWASLDIDITNVIIDFLASNALPETDRKRLVYHLVSELVRTHHFSVPRYLQWLIARGGLSHPSETAPDGPCLTRLLVEVPTHSLNDSMRRLRASVLWRAGYSAQAEADDIAKAITCVKHILGAPLEAHDPILGKPMELEKLVCAIRRSSRSLQSALGSWLSHDFVTRFAPCTQADKSSIAVTGFNLESVRTLLEAADDFSMLEHVLRTLATSSNAELLAACADTVNLHLQVFAAMGSARGLFDSLCERLKFISGGQGIGARPILFSLSRLAPRIPGLADLASQLQNELMRADRSNAVDASSPLSDNMATQLQDDETELNDSIEKLASYTSADRPTMERLFQTIINRLQNCWGKADERQKPYCVLMTRLRVFDPVHFDTMMRGWVQHIRKLTHRPPVMHIFPLLVSSGCLSLAVLFSTARPMMQTGQNQGGPGGPVGFASIYMQEVLRALMMEVSPNQFMTYEDCYRFRIIQQQARADHLKELMLLTRGALSEYSASRHQQPPIDQPLDEEQTQMQFLELLRSLILVDAHAASQTLLLKSPDIKLTALIETITTKLLIPEGDGGQKTFEQVLELANEFTLPFCQVKLLLNLACDESAGQNGSERLESHLALLSKAMDNALEADNIMWTGILSCLSPEVTQHMKNRAESRFLDLMPSLKSPAAMDPTSEHGLHTAENLFAVIDSIMRGAPTAKSAQLSNAMVDKLADQWEILASPTVESAPLKEATLSRWLPLLLSYLMLHASSTGAADSSKAAHELRGRACLALAGLTQELDSFRSPHLAARAFDLALMLVDGLSDEARLQCVRAVKEAASDPRLRYLFSFAPNPAEKLMMAHREKLAAGMSANEKRAMALSMGLGMAMLPERLSPFVMRRWEILNEPTPNVGENDTSLSLHLFEARKIQ